MGTDGLDNELEIVTHLNEKKFSEINNNLKRFLKFLNNNRELNEDTVIYARKLSKSVKTDIIITFNRTNYNISVKKGTGNSVHQETIDLFVDFINRHTNPSELIEDFRHFINSFDSNRTYFKKYPQKRRRIQQFFDLNARPLLIRFLKTGKFDVGHADYLYHGTLEKGKFETIDNVIDAMISESRRGSASLYVGHLTFQKWNTNNLKKRGSIQLKASTITNFLR